MDPLDLRSFVQLADKLPTWAEIMKDPVFSFMSTPSSAFNEDVQRNLRELRKTKLSAEELYATAQVTLQSIKAVDVRTMADPEANAPNFLVLAMAVYARDDLKDVLLAGAIDGMRLAALYPPRILRAQLVALATQPRSYQ